MNEYEKDFFACMIIVSFLACDFRSCFCRNKALRFLHIFRQEVGLFDVWIIDSTARLKHRSRDVRFVVHSINTHVSYLFPSASYLYPTCFLMFLVSYLFLNFSHLFPTCLLMFLICFLFVS